MATGNNNTFERKTGPEPGLKLLDENFDAQSSNQYVLSIQVSLGNIAIAVLNNRNNKYLALLSYHFSGLPAPGNAMSNLEGVFKSETWLRQSFNRVVICFEHPRYTLIPNALFDEEQTSEYLNLLYSEDDHSEIGYEEIKSIGAVNVHGIPSQMKDFFTSIYPECSFCHLATSLVESLFGFYKNVPTENKLLVNTRDDYLDICLIENNQLSFFNSFNYYAPEDFVYYLIFAMEQLNINPEEVELILLGEIDKKSDIADLAKKYIRKLNFQPRNNTFDYSYVFDKIPDHYYFNLLNLNLCG